MKSHFYFLISAIVLVCSGCAEEKRASEVTVISDSSIPVTAIAKNALTEGMVSKITAAEVPDTVKLSFRKNYPDVSVPEWNRYVPIESNDTPMDREYFYVVFANEGESITTWYDNRGQWVKTASKISGDPRLPDAVNKTINTQYPGYSIEEVDRENDKDMEMYEIKLKKGAEKAKLKILPNGDVVKRK